jgi:hypothetical protein
MVLGIGVCELRVCQTIQQIKFIRHLPAYATNLILWLSSLVFAGQ